MRYVTIREQIRTVNKESKSAIDPVRNNMFDVIQSKWSGVIIYNNFYEGVLYKWIEVDSSCQISFPFISLKRKHGIHMYGYIRSVLYTKNNELCTNEILCLIRWY